ncbi:hypothetical protein J0H58_20295 [bacterium]|nr:hypothetical protein [bacterium]
MVIRITRSLMLHEVVTPEGEVRRRIPVFAGQQFAVNEVYDEFDGFDWMGPEEGGVMPLPPDAWEVAVA